MLSSKIVKILCICVLALIPVAAVAQSTTAADAVAADGETSDVQIDRTVPRFSLLTCGPGAEIYELEGHTALRIRDDQRDEVVNWGVFDDTEPNFVYHFVAGETDYTCARQGTVEFVDSYRRRGRWVVEHDLMLTPEQAFRLDSLINENLKPENRVYRYKYISDNCATRPLNLIEQAIGKPLQQTYDAQAPEGNTYREMMRNYHRNYRWYQFGIDLVLGPDIDRPITQREKAFAPIYLEQMLSRTYYEDDQGRHHMLAAPGVALSRVPESITIADATPIPFRPVFISWVIFFVAITFTIRDIGRRRISRWFDSILYAIFGLGGLLLLFLVVISDHEATSPNWLTLWIDPLCLIVPLSIYSRYSRLVYYFQILNLLLIAIMIAIVIIMGRFMHNAFWPLIMADVSRAVADIVVFRQERKH